MYGAVDYPNPHVKKRNAIIFCYQCAFYPMPNLITGLFIYLQQNNYGRNY